MAHRTQLRVRFYELDPYNHLNHSVYIQYFEVARIELLESIGFGMVRLEGEGYRIVVTDLAIRYQASAGPGDELVVETEIADIRRASSTWRQRLLRNGVVLATQEITAASVDTVGRPVRFPAALGDALAAYLTPAGAAR